MARKPWVIRMRVAPLVLVLAALAPLRTRAEDRPTLLADHRPGSKSVALELGLGWYTDSNAGLTVHVLAPSLGGRFALSNSAELTLDWPFAFADVSPDMGNGDSSFRSGNPVAALYYMQRHEDGYFRIGGGIAAPLAHVSASDVFGAPTLAYAGASAMNGLWNIWQYAVDRLSLVLPGQFERRSGQFIYGSDFALGVLIDTGDGNRDALVSFQVAGILGARIDNVSLGARLQVVWLPTENGDNAQVALVPFVQGDFSDSGFVYARFVLNLDEPFGVFGNGTGLMSKVWGLHIGAGGRF